MINNDTVHRALGSLERFAPAEEAVLAGFREGVVKRRRRRQVASVVGATGAAGLVALGVVLVSPNKGSDQAPVAAQPTTSEVRIAKPPAPPALPFTVAGLPDGYRLDAWDVSATEASAQFVGTKDFQTIVVWTSAARRDPVEGATEEPATIAGRPGVIRRFDPGRAEQQLIWQLADGRWAMVGGRAPTVSLAMLRAVADSLTVTPTPLTAPVALGVLPDGYQVASWNGGGTGPVGGSATLCRGAAESGRGHQLPADCISLSTHEGTAPATVVKKKRTATEFVEEPVDQVKVVNGVSTRATADGTTVFAQLDAEYWTQAHSQAAGVELLREVVSTTGIK